jgi:selenocysteine lyase/cysteine desulfurase
MIRISTHVFNTDEEIDRLVNGIRRIQNSGY